MKKSVSISGQFNTAFGLHCPEFIRKFFKGSLHGTLEGSYCVETSIDISVEEMSELSRIDGVSVDKLSDYLQTRLVGDCKAITDAIETSAKGFENLYNGLEDRYEARSESKAAAAKAKAEKEAAEEAAKKEKKEKKEKDE